MQALWLANCSNVILFYPYFKASFLTPVKQVLGQTMEFKTTLKGANNSGFSLRTFGPAVLLFIINVVTFVAGALSLDANINAAKGISMAWIVFNTIPHLMLLLYAYFGPGQIMVILCRLFMFIMTGAGILAIVLMWLLYPREVSFEPALADSITFLQVRFPAVVPRCQATCFARGLLRSDQRAIPRGARPLPAHVQAQMSGVLAPDNPVQWRNDSGTQYTGIDVRSNGIKISHKLFNIPNLPAFNVSLDVSGGFYEDGPWGPVKLTKSNALSTAILGWSLLEAEESFRRDRTTLVRPFYASFFSVWNRCTLLEAGVALRHDRATLVRPCLVWSCCFLLVCRDRATLVRPCLACSCCLLLICRDCATEALATPAPLLFLRSAESVREPPCDPP